MFGVASSILLLAKGGLILAPASPLGNHGLLASIHPAATIDDEG
jgi:hypothetical protein